MPGPELKGKATLDTSDFDAKMARLAEVGKKAAASLAGNFKGIAGSLASPLAAILPAVAAAFAGKAIVSGVANVFEAGRALQILHRQTGASVQGLAILQGKFKAAGLEADGVGAAVFRLQKAISKTGTEEFKQDKELSGKIAKLESAIAKEENGSPRSRGNALAMTLAEHRQQLAQLRAMSDDGEGDGVGAANAIEKLGLNLEKLKSLAPDQQLFAVGRAISAIKEPTERTAAAMQIFGKSGAQYGALFNGAGFSEISAGLQAKAETLARNAATFERVSIKLERIGGIMKGFYLGVAERVVNVVEPLLDQINRTNLTGIGRQIGELFSKVSRVTIGAFRDPKTLFSGLADFIQGVGRSYANVVAAETRWLGNYLGPVATVFSNAIGTGMEAAGEIMQGAAEKFRATFMKVPLETIQEFIGGFNFITDTLPNKITAAFRVGLEYLHAGFEYSVTSLSGSMGKKLLDVAKNFAAVIMNPASGGAIAAAFASKSKDPSFAETFQRVQASGEFATAKIKEHSFGEHLENARGTVYEGAKDLFRKGNALDAAGNADISIGLFKLAQMGKTLPGQLMDALSNVPKFQVTDVAGAAPYLAAARKAVDKLEASGADYLQSLRDPTKSTDESNPANSSSPDHQAFVDTRTRAMMWAQHTIGNASSLDFSESYLAEGRGRPYTGAPGAFNRYGDNDWANYNGTGSAFRGQTGLTSGGLGGGAYGQTGNVFTQISGMVGKRKDPAEKSADLLGQLNTKFDKYWGPGSGGGGGSTGGVTAASK